MREEGGGYVLVRHCVEATEGKSPTNAGGSETLITNHKHFFVHDLSCVALLWLFHNQWPRSTWALCHVVWCGRTGLNPQQQTRQFLRLQVGFCCFFFCATGSGKAGSNSSVDYYVLVQGRIPGILLSIAAFIHSPRSTAVRLCPPQ